MVGVVVVTHGNIGQEMVEAAQRIIPEAKHLRAVSVACDAPLAEASGKIRDAVVAVQTGQGVLILTDLFGGTPSNIALSFLDEPNIEVVSGVNLPMLIKLASGELKMSFAELVLFIQRYGQKNIVVGRGVLRGEIEK